MLKLVTTCGGTAEIEIRKESEGNFTMRFFQHNLEGVEWVMFIKQEDFERLMCEMLREINGGKDYTYLNAESILNKLNDCKNTDYDAEDFNEGLDCAIGAIEEMMEENK